MAAIDSFPLAHIRLEALVAQLEDAVVLEDEHRRLHTANAAFCRTFGIDAPPAALRGADCAEAAKAVARDFRDPEAFLRGIDLRLEARVARSGERLELRDGRTLERDYIPVWSDDTYRGHLWVYRDVTALADAARDVERARGELERFIDLLSHEFRSPLATAAGVVERLRASPLDPDQAELVSTLHAAVETMADVIGESHDRALVRLDRGPLSLSLEPCRLDDAVLAVVAIERVDALRRGLDVDVVAHDTDDLQVWLDRRRFRMLLSNLLRNAVRYTPRGAIHLSVRVAPGTRSDRRSIDVRVADSGVGIPADEQARIFEPYARGRDAPGSGLGLGLYLSRRIAEAMGGSLELTRSGPTGSEFRLWFEAEVVEQTPGGGGIGDARVLVVDDDPSMARLLVHILEQAGARCVTATSAPAALEAMSQRAFDAALVDFSLGQASSEPVVVALQARGIPVVILSGHDDPGVLGRISALGVQARLRKPATVEALVSALSTAMRPALGGTPR